MLKDYQTEAISKLKRGSILYGGVGSGKSRTAIGYVVDKYKYKQELGEAGLLLNIEIVVITTAKKRDNFDWDREALVFRLDRTIGWTVDSWNNISKYEKKTNCFFIFDEQRVIGTGAWVKSFLKIAKNNDWILLTATPGDVWIEYMPVFVANGFYKNKTEFLVKHVVYSRYTTYPKISKYLDIPKLKKLRDEVLVIMNAKESIDRTIEYIECEYNTEKYHITQKEYFDFDKQEPIKSASELCYALRRIVNSDNDRFEKLFPIIDKYKKVIIFYNYDYELMLLRTLSEKYTVTEYNGHRHQEIPDEDSWVYLVQYTAGAEGWNCIETNCIIFFSQNYSYKLMEQAKGRIDRMNTRFAILHYFIMTSKSTIDKAITAVVNSKKKFNEEIFCRS